MTATFDAEIRHATFVRAPRDRVYDAFATSRGLDGWFTTGATVDARPDGTMHWRWKDWGPDRVTAEDRARVLEARRPERFVFEWHGPRDPERPSTVELDFEERDGGTVVRLRERGYPDTPAGREAFADCAAGWGEALTLLKFYVEHGLRYEVPS
ncbi:MAG: SRPBCC domain-containing protein [Actinomycetota bacterium]|nr:SRPBCC domain-containing protein [Actinomycetota bacterium]